MTLEPEVEFEEKPKVKRTYRQKDRRNNNMTRIIVTPTDTTELRAYYEIYMLECQRTNHIVPKFRYFITEMAKIGFLAWQEKNKGK